MFATSKILLGEKIPPSPMLPGLFLFASLSQLFMPRDRPLIWPESSRYAGMLFPTLLNLISKDWRMKSYILFLPRLVNHFSPLRSLSPILSDSCGCGVGRESAAGRPSTLFSPPLLLCTAGQPSFSSARFGILQQHRFRLRGKNSLPFLLRNRDSYLELFLPLLLPFSPLVSRARDECLWESKWEAVYILSPCCRLPE